MMIKRLILLAVFWALAGTAQADRPALEFRLTFDYFQLDQSDIRGLNGMSLFYTTDDGYYIGESLYSAAFGKGGGFFVGGFELGKHTQIGDGYFWDASLFVGGGGGANQVPGDGLMLRPQIHAGYDFGSYRLGAGVSYVSVSGSDISTPTFGLTFTRQLNLAVLDGSPTGERSVSGATRFSAMKPIMGIYYPINSNKRYSGGALHSMQLLGTEISFARTDNSESYLQANGVVSGDAEGYADWILGKRYFSGQGPLRFYAEFGGGIGGGGAVDTGGGLIVTAGGGLRIMANERFGAELGFRAVRSINGDFMALSPSLKLDLAFAPGETRWQVSTGFTQQFPNADFRKSGVPNTGSPLMIDTEIDLFVTKDLYLTGHAYTALSGGAGGYQIGLIGLGYRIPVAEKLSISAEVMLGAGGGAGVDTRGGLLAAYKIDVDYHLRDTVYLTVGAGQVRTLQGGGMQPATLNIGLKFPFTTLH